jgi:chloramphenicol-sensitive protein RarD
LDSKNMSGVTYAVLASLLWGILPIYWNLINYIPSIQILAHRIVWSFVFTSLLLLLNKQLSSLKAIVSKKTDIKLIFLASAVITINWGLYIWAVNNNQILESSMGYYIYPLISVLCGVAFFKEKLDVCQKVSLALALTGVIIQVVQYGKIPWVSLLLAVTFAYYGVLKKLIKVDSTIGLALETGIVTPIALIYILTKQLNGTGVLGSISAVDLLLLIGSGIVTAGPLLLLSIAAKKIPLSTLGFTQYISPTLGLIIGIFVYHEHFTMTHLVSFCFIWCGLIIYSLSQTELIERDFIQ